MFLHSLSISTRKNTLTSLSLRLMMEAALVAFLKHQRAAASASAKKEGGDEEEEE